MIRTRVRSLFTTRRAFGMVLALGFFVMAARGISDPDFWWHLRTGELIIQTHSVLRTDPFSFTRFGRRWVNHEWLSDVLIFAVYRAAGFGGLIVSFAAVTAATFLLIYRRCEGRPYFAAFLTLWGAQAAILSWGVRPQMFTLLLATVFLLIIDRSDERPAILWWTVPLSLLWVNLHAGYAVGIGLLALALIGAFLEAAFVSGQYARLNENRRTLALAFVACLAVVPLNPNGARLFWYPLETLRSRTMQAYINEWFSPDFHQARYLFFLAMLLTTLVMVAIFPRRVRPREILFLSVALFAALRSVRHIPVFVLIAVPVLSKLPASWVEKGKPPAWLFPPKPRPGTWRTSVLNAVIVALFATLTLARIRHVVRDQPQLEADHFPARAVEFVRSQQPSAPVLNYYNWGGYFIWKLYPDYRVFIDGRADLYGDRFMNDLAASYYLTDRWQGSLQEWGIRSVVLPPDAPLIRALEFESGWKRVFTDSQAAVLTRQVNNSTGQ
jgi:hypothetical protein